MDTISHEDKRNYPLLAGALAGILISVVLTVLWGVTLSKVNALAKRVETLSERMTSVPGDLPNRLASIETDSRNAAAAADKVGKDITSLRDSTQRAFDSIGPEIGGMKASIAKLEEAAMARAAVQEARTAEFATVAGPGEYIVKPGDTGTKIAKATGASLGDLEAANPGLDWKRLRIGQKIKTR